MIEENVRVKEGYNIDPNYTKEWLPELSALEPFLKVSDKDAADAQANITQFTKEHGAQAYNRAMIVGRFQPPHAGHLYVIESALAVAKEVVVALGSANIRDKDNPFSALQREMILRQELKKLKQKGIDPNRVKFVYLNDYGDNDKWRDKTVKQMQEVGGVDAVIGNSDWVNDIFQDKRVLTKKFENQKIAVLRPPRLNRAFFKGTEIRKLLRESGALVPFGLTPAIKVLSGKV